MKNWFITGAGSGFGYELTTLLLDRGDRVAATARRPEALAGLADRHGDRLWAATLDVADTPALRRVVVDAFTALGRVDVVVSNAGFGLLGAAEEVSDELLARQLDVNLVSAIQLARAVVPPLRAQGGGRIIQMSSSGGQVPDPGMSLYNATKFGVEGFYESLALEVAPFGIEVTLVEPGGSRTNFNRNLALAEPLDAYRDTIVGQVRGMLGADVEPEVLRRLITGDPAKAARAVAESVDVSPAPKRIVLGANTYEQIAATLEERLAALRAQRDLAYSTDADDIVAAR
ncbi:SDR family oxidoreductase [Asanoa siamensis]|uniref:Short-chain dehydrogenase/reductase n=1 Tax=Asanoa siamensis TaxID=926357 RepID=A0ABQ4CMS1_9ACTN|nr:SDR family oxidoreductase [Asanoa siamensis]GIF72581.1 short-chain dehydrogenase/reductase [Asanoa siamensis]